MLAAVAAAAKTGTLPGCSGVTEGPVMWGSALLAASDVKEPKNHSPCR
jgi:hypothetical protein